MTWLETDRYVGSDGLVHVSCMDNGRGDPEYYADKDTRFWLCLEVQYLYVDTTDPVTCLRCLAYAPACSRSANWSAPREPSSADCGNAGSTPALEPL